MSENRRKHAKPIVVPLFTNNEAQALNFEHAPTQTLRVHLSKSRTPGAALHWLLFSLGKSELVSCLNIWKKQTYYTLSRDP